MLSRPKKLPLLATLLTLGLLAGCSSADEDEPEPAPPADGGVYSEIHDFAEVQAGLPLLSARNLRLVQVIGPDDFPSPQLAALIRACNDAAIELRAWLVLAQDDGYWPGETNLAAFGVLVDDFLAWTASEDLEVAMITFDMEPDWQYTHEMKAIAEDTDNPDRTEQLVDLIRSHHDPAAFAAATAELSDIVDRIHDAGLQAHAVTYPVVLDDFADGDPDIQDGLDIPIEGIDWDEVTFMVYRSAMESLGGAAIDKDIFYSYGLSAYESFGERAGLDYGLVGTGVLTVDGSYEQPEPLYIDVAQGRAAGIGRLHLYSFEGCRAQTDPAPWLDYAATPPAEPPADGPAKHSLRITFTLLDALLDSAPQ